jgi:hypothetical protein
MADNDVRSMIDTIRTRLQTELDAQLVTLELHHNEAVEQARRDIEARLNQDWSARLDAVREEWQGRLQSQRSEAAAEAERRVSAETARVRAEVEQVTEESTARVRLEMEQAALGSTARVREEMEKAAAESTARLREEMDRTLAAERERIRAEVDAERERMQSALTGERDSLSVELETERLKARALTAALEEARTALGQERESARAVASLHQARETDEATEARAAERQSQLATVEGILGGVRTIGNARSLSDTLTALVTASGTVAPRVALFILNGRELQWWRGAGFGDDRSSSLRIPVDDVELLAAAVNSGSAVSTASARAPGFALLRTDRAGLAVPITVGGQSVAVLYADDGSPEEPEAPASWPEAVQILAGHASACLAQITASRTVQAMRRMPAAPGAAQVADAVIGSEEDSSARRYARLLVSEIKLYNESAVRVGREKRDLLERLRPEIERARRLYEERVAPSVGARAVYFQQELVHTLADGDSALLGNMTT